MPGISSLLCKQGSCIRKALREQWLRKICIYIHIYTYIDRYIYIYIRHHAKPKRAPATAPLRTGADMCKTGVGAGSSTGVYKEPDRRQSNYERTDDQSGKRRLANTDSDGGSLVHAADDTPIKNAATRDKHCNFMRQGGGTSQCSSKVEEERDEKSRGSHIRGMIRRNRCKQHRRCMIRPKTRLIRGHPGEV